MGDMAYFQCWNSYRATTSTLTDEELGKLFRALMDYNTTGKKQQMDGRVEVAFAFIVGDIDRAKEHYDEKCKKNSENGSKGGRPSKKNKGTINSAEKRPYGGKKNVLLTDDEFETLKNNYPKNHSLIIEQVSEYINNAPTVYNDHFNLCEQIAAAG